jgi:hypothetical protein
MTKLCQQTINCVDKNVELIKLNYYWKIGLIDRVWFECPAGGYNQPLRAGFTH